MSGKCQGILNRLKCGNPALLCKKGNHAENKKVLLRERKRHTARRVVSTPSVILPGYPPPPPSWPGRGGTRSGPPPPGGYPVRYPPGGVPGQVPPPPRPGYPPPPRCPMAFWEMLQSIMGYGYPPPGVDRQTKWNYYLPVVLRTRAVIKHIVIVNHLQKTMTYLIIIA